MQLEKRRADFPILNKLFDGRPLIYFDNACVTLKPRQVVAAVNRYYEEFPACGGRSLHRLGRAVTEEVEKARAAVAGFFNARSMKEIVFTKNSTEAINLVAHSLEFRAGDRILTTDKEHNSNLLPWQFLAKSKSVQHEVVASNADNTFNIENFEKQVDDKVRLVAMVHSSNLDGVTTPAEDVIKIAHDHGALVLLDAAQSAPHKAVDVRRLDVDFLACSGHKMCGPSGTGVLYAKQDLLEQMRPFIVGGDTVTDSTYTTASMEKPPEKFEAGLQDYAGIIGLAAAVQYLSGVGLKVVEQHENELNKRITEGISGLPGISIIGPADARLRGGIMSFNIKGMDSHEVAMLLDRTANIAIRSGAHCVHSWFNAHGLNGSARASLYFYNTAAEADVFVENVGKVVKLLQ